MPLPLPRSVGPGSHLRIVAPSGPFDAEAFKQGVSWLRKRYEVSYADDIFAAEGYFAGSDSQRLERLNEAIADPGVDAILCARGGFGATRILPGIDLESIREANKLIVGFSDVTALHSLWAKAGVRSIHAPMVAALGRSPDPIRSAWIETLEDPETSTKHDLSRLDSSALATTTGRFFGGNLAVLAALNGTPFSPDLDGVILFLEDVGERPYRIDRLLTTLRQSGWFDRLAGLVLGAFTEGEPGADGTSIDDVFCQHFHDTPFPVLSGLAAGHITENIPLGFGGDAVIEGAKLSLE